MWKTEMKYLQIFLWTDIKHVQVLEYTPRTYLIVKVRVTFSIVYISW